MALLPVKYKGKELGKAADRNDAAVMFVDYCAAKHSDKFEGEYNNFTQLRSMCVDEELDLCTFAVVQYNHIGAPHFSVEKRS